MIKYEDIDKDFKTLIPYLIHKGYKTFASCDGVLANHINPNEVTLAYISFMYSHKVLELFSLFAKDKDFSLVMQTPNHTKSYQYGGNTISGNTYAVYFDNKDGSFTNFNSDDREKNLDTLSTKTLPYFHRIIKSYEEDLVQPDTNTLGLLQKITQTLQNAEQSDLCFQISTNTQIFHPFIDKANYLEITTKYGTGTIINLCELYDLLKEKNISKIVSETRPVDFTHSNSNTILSVSDFNIFVKFTDNQFDEILDIINFAKENESKLSRKEIDESDFDDSELYYEDFENYYTDDLDLDI